MKPLGYKSYGSIPHLIGSRMGPADHHASPGQCVIATEKERDKNDFVIVQEKLDGGNVAIAKHKGEILALTRSGYLATTSPYKTHLAFYYYVKRNEKRFNELLNDGERISGEWLLTAVGTLYDLPHEPFVPFDLFFEKKRYNYHEFVARLAYSHLPIARVLHLGSPCSIESALEMIKVSGHGAKEEVEGAIWIVESNSEFDFAVKYVRPEKVDGKYLDQNIVNGMPLEFYYLKDYL
jgi:ATP-dependent RNA circularization protein (DNA/RNA ligase family)